MRLLRYTRETALFVNVLRQRLLIVVGCVAILVGSQSSCTENPPNTNTNTNTNTNINSTANSSPLPTVSSSPVGFDIDREVDRMKEGVAITEIPTSMELDDTRRVVLVLAPQPSIAESAEAKLKRELAERAERAPERKLESKTQIETETAKYSSFMEAKLTGQGFDIKPITPERQPVSNTQETRWSWDVKAVSAGDQELYLALNAIFEGSGAEKTRTVTTFSKPIRVRVSWASSVSTFAAKNWQWFVTVIFIPILAWGGPRLWRLVKKENKP